MTLEMMIEQVKELTLEERKALLHALIDTLTDEPYPKTHSIMELEGLGAEIWEGIDSDAYLKEMRDEWDRHP